MFHVLLLYRLFLFSFFLFDVSRSQLFLLLIFGSFAFQSFIFRSFALRLGRTWPLVAPTTCRPRTTPHVTTAELHGAAAGHVHRTCHRCTQQASKRRESGRSLLASAQGHISLKAGGGSRAALALTRAASSDSDRTRGVMPMWRVTPWTQKIEKAAPRRARARPPPGPHAAGRQGRRAMTRFEPTVPRSLVFVSLNK